MSRSEDYVPKKGRRQTKPEAKQETAAKPNGPLPDNDGWLAEMNAKYCVVQDGGRIDVLMFERHVQRVGKDEHDRNVPVFLTFESLRNKHCNQTVPVVERKNDIETTVRKRLGDWWLKHPLRRQYEGLIFQPGGAEVINGRLNLWKGWGVEPKPGDWSLMREHIRTVIAAGVEANFVYIMNWLAWAVQYPDQQAEVALVLIGLRGTGKGTLGNTMMRLFGQHGVHISDAKHLIGFNEHLRDACFLFADEAYWPGDKSAEGNFKRLISEPDLFIEGKGRKGVYEPNMLHILMASNEDWVIPAGERERRFAGFGVSEIHIQEEKYFNALYEQLENGGYGAMLYDLLHRDIRGWHPRQLPRTDVLLDQQRRSLSMFEAWWVELLEGGVLEGADPLFPGHAVSNSYDQEIIETDGYGGRRTRYVKQNGLYDQARSVSPRLRQHASDLREQGCTPKKVLQRRGWWFPDLLDARKAWEEHFPGWNWRHPTIVGWGFKDTSEDTSDSRSSDPNDDENEIRF